MFKGKIGHYQFCSSKVRRCVVLTEHNGLLFTDNDTAPKFESTEVNIKAT